jgi:hypothetical protein
MALIFKCCINKAQHFLHKFYKQIVKKISSQKIKVKKLYMIKKQKYF